MYCKLGQNGNSEIMSKINVTGVKVPIVCVWKYPLFVFIFMAFNFLFSQNIFRATFYCILSMEYEMGYILWKCLCVYYLSTNLHSGWWLLTLVVQVKSFWVNFILFHIPAQFVLLMLFGKPIEVGLIEQSESLKERSYALWGWLVGWFPKIALVLRETKTATL